MGKIEYQKKQIFELMNLDAFIKKNNSIKNNDNLETKRSIKSPFEAKSIKDLKHYLLSQISKNLKKIPEEFNLVEGNINSKLLFIYGVNNFGDKKILDNEEGELFDKMLSAIN